MYMEFVYRILLVLVTAAFFVTCDTLSAHWGRNGGILYLLLIINLAPIGYFLFAFLNRSNSLSISSGMVNMVIIIGTIAIGVFGFHDALTAKQIIGLILAVCAVILMI